MAWTAETISCTFCRAPSDPNPSLSYSSSRDLCRQTAICTPVWIIQCRLWRLCWGDRTSRRRPWPCLVARTIPYDEELAGCRWPSMASCLSRWASNWDRDQSWNHIQIAESYSSCSQFLPAHTAPTQLLAFQSLDERTEQKYYRIAWSYQGRRILFVCVILAGSATRCYQSVASLIRHLHLHRRRWSQLWQGIEWAIRNCSH